MQRKFRSVLLLGIVCIIAFLTSCSDHKTPMKGYISEDEVYSIVTKFDETTSYTKYAYEGTLNYFGYADEIVPNSVSKRNQEFQDSLDIYRDSCSSYYLRLPLHITLANWTTTESNGLSLSTKYQLESKLYRPAGYDSIYYYNREGGGFILRTFGVNKALIIKKPSDITCRGKWPRQFLIL